MTQQRKQWSVEEDRIVSGMWNDSTIAEIAKRLNRTSGSVAERAQKIGIRNQEREWTDSEIETLVSLHMSVGASEISKILGRGIGSIKYKIRDLGLKKKHVDWQFSSMTPSLAHLVGVYLTDGHISNPHEDVLSRQFSTTSIDREFVEASLIAYKNLCGKHYYARPVTMSDRYRGKQPWQIKMTCGPLNTWISDTCEFKDRFPKEMYVADTDSKLAFVSAMLDGDGWISVDSERNRYTIGFGSENSWINEFSSFLISNNIKTSRLRTRTMKSGKPFYEFQIDKPSFVNAGGYFRINRKMDRLKKYAESVLEMSPQRLYARPLY